MISSVQRQVLGISTAALALVVGAGANAETPSTAPTSINARFLTAEPEELGFLESESREVFANRAQVVAALAIAPGSRVADVGAGTGAYLDVLAKAVGPEGRLYAVDIAPKLVAHLRDRAKAAGLEQVTAVQGSAVATGLDEGSVDLVFTSDTYHHFEDPAATNADIRRALREDGRYAVLDFEREPGRSRDWVLEHVRAGKETVIAEVEAAGFALESELEVDGLKENYLLVFRRR